MLDDGYQDARPEAWHMHVCSTEARLWGIAAGQKGKQALPDELWAIMRQHYEEQTPVNGRILNDVKGGYAVGIAGFVAFCPFRACSVLTASRTGILQPFIINRLDEERRQMIVADHRMELQSAALNQRQRQRQRRYPPNQ